MFSNKKSLFNFSSNCAYFYVLIYFSQVYYILTMNNYLIDFFKDKIRGFLILFKIFSLSCTSITL